MAGEDDREQEARILPPDYSLWEKIGSVNLDLIFTPHAIEEAQRAITEKSRDLLDEVASDMKSLDRAWKELSSSPDRWRGIFPNIVSAAFAIKTKAGLGDCELIATVSKSLQLFCEQPGRHGLSERDIEIIAWHVDSIKRLVALKISGSGGDLGKAILAEMEKIKPE